jgi:plastocyanin
MRQSMWVAVVVATLAGACESGPSSNALTSPSVSAPASAAMVAGQGTGGASEAVMQFGQGNVGSPAPPGSTHDQSAHAKDNIVPGTVVLAAGGTVTFDIPAGVHQIAIYAPGTTPDDIDTSILTTLSAQAGCAGNPVVNAPLVINDPAHRVAVIPVPCFAPTQKTYTFPAAGKYLVVCAFLPHFQAGMYGWIDVK